MLCLAIDITWSREMAGEIGLDDLQKVPFSQTTLRFYRFRRLRMVRHTPEILWDFSIDVVVQIFLLFSAIIVFNLLPCPHQVWAAFSNSVTRSLLFCDIDDPFSDVDFL